MTFSIRSSRSLRSDIVFAFSIAIALYVVATFVIRSHPNKPVPNPNQVSTSAATR